MTFDEEKYRQFEDKLYSISNELKMEDEQINEIFDELLKVLPNGGRLYKYKPLNKYCIDALENKYVWFSAPKLLNDKKDCTFNANSKEQIEDLVKFLVIDDHYRKFLINGFYLNLYQNHIEVTPEIIEGNIRSILINGPKLAKRIFERFCYEYKLSKEQQQEFKIVIRNCHNKNPDENFIRNSISHLHEQMQKLRSGLRVLSLSTSYDKDNMWAYYGDNKGICIEYDFRKIDSTKAKRLFMNTQKVRYAKKQKFHFVDIIKAKISDNLQDIVNADKMIIEQELTKDMSWSTEEEWRTLVFVYENGIGLQAEVDVVSAIYIDYSILEEEKTKRIIELAQKNGWSIYIRYFSEFEAEYRYDTIENINKLIEKMNG